MRTILTAFMLFVLPLVSPVTAQSSEQADKSFIENWLQDTLSEAGRNVTVTGFAGALSSNATLESLTIADADGVWFTMRGASLVWSRSALLSGRLDITEITAREIILERLPQTDSGMTIEAAEATQFALPELPVSVEIDLIRAGNITLGQDVIGEPASLSLNGNVALIDGDGAAQLEVRRTDRADALVFDGAFSNKTRVLKLDLDFQEARDGLVSTLLRIPDAPALRLQVSGEAPLSDFTARLSLGSDGQRRFGGSVIIAALNDPSDSGYAFSADFDGDIRPLVSTDLHRFFGEASNLTVKGETRSDGRLLLEDIEIASGALQANGRLNLGPSGLPESIDLRGEINGEGDVRLPLSGPVTTVRRAEITASFDAARDDTWQAEARVLGLSRDGLKLDRAYLRGTGQISNAPEQSVSAELTFEVSGVSHQDPALERAIGPAPSGFADLVWQPEQPLIFNRLRIESGETNLIAQGRIDSLDDGFPVTGTATLQSTNLSRFAALAGQGIDGAATATVDGAGALLGGAFDLTLKAETHDLSIGETRVDPLLAGQGKLTLSANRSETGTRLESLVVQTDAVSATVSGGLSTQEGQLDVDARIMEIALVEPKLSGPARFDTALSWRAGQALTLSRLEAGAVGATLSATGVVFPERPGIPAEGEATVTASDLSRLAGFVGRPLAGRLQLTLDGSGQLQGQNFDIKADLDGDNLRTGLAEVDRLIAGQLSAAASLAIGEVAPDIRNLTVTTPRLDLQANGNGPGAPIAVSVRLADLGTFVPGFPGTFSTNGTVTVSDRLARQIQIALDANGPGGTSARVTGAVRDYGQTLSISSTGSAPLGLVNRFISPRSLDGLARFDLSVDGPPRLSSLSGVVTLSNGRLALPRFASALGPLAGTVRLVSGRAETDITGSAGDGGSFRMQGPVSLQPPFAADLQTTLSDLGVSDPNLYRTTLSGSIGVTGPLTAGARISGAIALGRTELRVPSGGGRTPGAIADITHVNEPAAVRTTRRRAGLLDISQGQMVAYPLDLTISAPNRIFVRGRGLDAELGGQLRLGGTTANVTASGLFELIRGRLDILGRRLTLTQGLIDLRGALDPYLRFVAETEADDITVRVILEGLASAPSVVFESTPDLPQDEVVARLLFGRGLDSISPFQAAQLVTAAATLSGQRSGGLTGGLRSAFSLSDLDITSGEDGATQLRAGAYLSENIYSEVTADSEGNQEINLNLDLTPNITVKGSTGTDGNTGVGVFFEKDY